VNLHPLISATASLLVVERARDVADRVVLEITERGALGEEANAQDRIRRLRSAGYRIAIDDLGAGYSGLSSVAMLEPAS